MKRMICLLLAALLLFAGAAAAEAPSSETEEGILYTAEPTNGAGGYCILTLKDALRLTPDDTFAGDVSWTSTDTNVAAVEDGLVRPVGPGATDIYFTDGTAEGVCSVLVDDTPKAAEPAGALHIELNGKTYESNISLQTWSGLKLTPRRLHGTDGNMVYTADGRYFVRSDVLHNIACCALGKTRVLEGYPGGLQQICGDCAITETDVAAAVTRCGDIVLYTYPRVYQMPDGAYVGKDLYTLIAVGGEYTDAACYGYLAADGHSYEDIADYLGRFGIAYETDYDAGQAVLTVRLLPEEGK